MGTTMLEHSWAKIVAGRCYADSAALTPEEEGGWRRCPKCGRSSRITSEAREERIPIPLSARGKFTAIRGDHCVLETGDVLSIDSMGPVPANAVAMHFSYPLPS